MDPVFASGFPRAIAHFDGDAFFTSVEQSLCPALRGRPVVTGRERGIIACASYEARALGIRRGVALWEARRRCPDLVVLPSDYENYSLFSLRMFEIVRRITPCVEEYSIDEGFADLTGLRRLFRCGYGGIVRRIQSDLQAELGLSVSVGLSLSKSLAKLASKARKPAGATLVAGLDIPGFLRGRPVSEVWGLGPGSTALLCARGVATAWDFACRPEDWVRRLLGKPGAEIHAELRGEAVRRVDSSARGPPAGVSRGRTFPAPSGDRDTVFAELARNAESAFARLRRHRLRAGRLAVSLRSREYRERVLECRLPRPAVSAQEALPQVRALFDRLFEPGAAYRHTGIGLGALEPDREIQYELFEDPSRDARRRTLSAVADAVNARYGSRTLCTANALFLDRHPATDRAALPARRTDPLPGETARRRLGLPRLDLRV